MQMYEFENIMHAHISHLKAYGGGGVVYMLERVKDFCVCSRKVEHLLVCSGGGVEYFACHQPNFHDCHPPSLECYPI